MKTMLGFGVKDAKTYGGKSLLHLAVLRNSPDIVEVLLKHGVDVNMLDFMGRTPLHLAAEKGFPCILEQLLKHGADVGLTDNRGVSALHLAVHSISGSKLDEECALETVKTLLTHHAQFAATNHQVSQAYHTFLEVVGLLFNG